MTTSPSLMWLRDNPYWRAEFAAWRADSCATWEIAVQLANTRLDFVQTNMLDRAVQDRFGPNGPAGLATKPIRLAILGTSTVSHLHAGIRIAGLRRGMWISTYESAFGQYLQELVDTGSHLHAFEPTAVLFSLDSHHIALGASVCLSPTAAGEELRNTKDQIQHCWQLARRSFRCQVLQQTLLPVFPAILGSNEHRLVGSSCHMVQQINMELRSMTVDEGVDLVAVDDRAAIDGLAAWHDPALWCRSKQEISPNAVPLYGDLVTRVLAAQRGLSSKCLVLDLDDTLWGGVVADCAIEGLVLGQGSALGEGFAAMQKYAKELKRRGVILAVCSKNNEAAAMEPFERHPEMVLRLEDISCFAANWDDKATNIRRIAAQLNIGLGSLVFVDDNPAERELVRRELPEVAVPELPCEPSLIPYRLAEAGYFEALTITNEDLQRTQQYQDNALRGKFMASGTDMDGFLRSLQMRLVWRPFDRTGLTRIVQLINKTNQFNLTTRRYTVDEVLAVMSDTHAIGLQFRLMDRFGDNGIIAIVIGKMQQEDLYIDTWLMSCRVLGRHVENATLAQIVDSARTLGAKRIVGQYIETPKNALVKDHYLKMGFKCTAQAPTNTFATLEIADFVPTNTHILIEEEQYADSFGN